MSQRQQGVLLVLALLLSSIGVASAEDGTGLHTSIENLEPVNGMHFISGEVIEFKIQAVNTDSVAHSIEYNPTCPYNFQIVDSIGQPFHFHAALFGNLRILLYCLMLMPKL